MRKYLDGGAAKSGGLHQVNQHHNRGGCCPNSWSGRRLRSSGGRSSRHCPRVERPTTMMVTLSMLLLSMFANDGAAFRNQPPLPLMGRASQVATRNYTPAHDPFQRSSTSSTSLSYKNDRGDLPDQEQDIFSRSKRSKVRPSKKRYKARKPSTRSYRLHKNGMPATEEELVHHVQSVFSHLKEFGEEDEEELCILSETGEDGCDSSSLSATQQQLDSCRKLDRHSALVLNADYRPLRMLPLSIWSWQDTVKAVLSGKAVVVDIYPDVFVRAVSLDIPVPSVIALLEYSQTGKARPAFTRRNVFLRDGYRCQYCSELFRTPNLSLDHVEPRCMGGKLSWDNTVTCCRKCNGRKGCLCPSELHRVGMELQAQPRCPSLYELSAEATKFVPRRVHPTWAPFLGLKTEEEEEEEDCFL
mmetsp:Transcript_23016/g.40396  ORF Transcript_23016/g.40396 Transcript_23016/m.40396 type:complete len:414 (-) Transcript_23016:65-1306(-)